MGFWFSDRLVSYDSALWANGKDSTKMYACGMVYIVSDPTRYMSILNKALKTRWIHIHETRAYRFND